MRPYEFKTENIEIFLEDDGKQKAGSIDGHIYVRSYIYGFSKEDTLEGVVRKLEEIIKELEKAKNELVFFENGK